MTTPSQKEVFSFTETQSTATRTVILSGLAATLIAFCCFGACLLSFVIPQLLSGRLPARIGQFTGWDALGSITSLATFALLMGGLVFAFIDYTQNAVQRKREASEASFNMYKEVYDRLMSTDSIAARRWVIVNLPTRNEMKDEQAWFECVKNMVNEIPAGKKLDRAPGKEYVKRILNDLDFIGFVNQNYWRMDNDLVKWMSSPVAKVWERIYLYVQKEGEEREEIDYYRAAREFGEQCVKWRNDHDLKSKVITNGT